jgi:flavorubredoxin
MQSGSLQVDRPADNSILRKLTTVRFFSIFRSPLYNLHSKFCELTTEEKVALIVQKFGGTSVGDIERIKNVARKVIATKKAGNRVVVVVSAMSGETDKLINLAKQMSPNPSRRKWT